MFEIRKSVLKYFSVEIVESYLHKKKSFSLRNKGFMAVLKIWPEITKRGENRNFFHKSEFFPKIRQFSANLK